MLERVLHIAIAVLLAGDFLALGYMIWQDVAEHIRER